MVELAPSKYPVHVFPASLVVTAWASHILAKESCWEICSAVLGEVLLLAVCVCVCVSDVGRNFSLSGPDVLL